MGIGTLTESSQKALSVFFETPKEEHYVRDVARKSGLPVKTASWNLIKLADLKILARKKKGREVWYSLNHENEMTKKLCDMHEASKTGAFLEKNYNLKISISEFLNSLGALFGDPILFVVLFGSHARGYATKKSDVDTLIVVREGRKEDYAKWKKRIDGVADKIRARYGLVLSAVFMTLKDFRENLEKKEPFIVGILKDHYVLYGAELYVKEVFSWLITKK